MDYNQIKQESKKAILEVIEKANLKEGDIFIVGCSSSEIAGSRIGKNSNIDVAKAVFDGIYSQLWHIGVYLGAQCCEHLNRAVVIERSALKPWQDEVNVVPQLHAGGSFSVTCYEHFDNPVIVENVRGAAGMDIGDTLIGMHLKEVVVPLRIETKKIGEAHLLCARTRPKFIGGFRAIYDEKLSGGEIER